MLDWIHETFCVGFQATAGLIILAAFIAVVIVYWNIVLIICLGLLLAATCVFTLGCLVRVLGNLVQLLGSYIC